MILKGKHALGVIEDYHGRSRVRIRFPSINTADPVQTWSGLDPGLSHLCTTIVSLTDIFDLTSISQYTLGW
jgi:hypothetical protein